MSLTFHRASVLPCTGCTIYVHQNILYSIAVSSRESLFNLQTADHLFSSELLIQLIQGGKGEAIRIRAILRSLIPIQDLEGVISIAFQFPSVSKGLHHYSQLILYKTTETGLVYNQCLFKSDCIDLLLTP